MSYDIPQLHVQDNSLEAQVIEAIVNRDHVSPEEAVLRVLRSVRPATLVQTATPRRSYASYFGAVKNGYGTPEVADRAIEELRNEW